VTPFKISSTPRDQTILFGLRYACNNFGHKSINLRENSININNFESHAQNGYPRRTSETLRISYNRFESLRTNVTTTSEAIFFFFFFFQELRGKKAMTTTV
jgi:hypothetical protein